MNTPLSPDAIHGEDADLRYSLDVMAELTGVETSTILHYQQQGLLRSMTNPSEAGYDTETLRQLRLIEHLRVTFEMNEASLKLIIDLWSEVETLRQERRQSLR